MLQRFLLLWLLILCAIAGVWPSIAANFPASWNGFDPFVASKPLLSWMISVTMFAIGCLIRQEELTAVGRRWPAVFGGTATQYLVMPLLAWTAAKLLGLEGPLLTGVVMVGCVPGAMASNVLTLAAGGNVSYSVSLTTLATLLSPVVVPFALLLTIGQSRPVDPIEAGQLLLLQVVLPVVAGHLLCRRWHTLERTMEVVGPRIANFTILWIIAAVVGLNRDRLGFGSQAVAESAISLRLVAALLMINLGGYAAGFGAGGLLRIDSPMRRALTLEIGLQNAGLGTAMVVKLFPDSPEAAIPTAAYTFGCMLTGTILANWWALSGNRPADEDSADSAVSDR